MKKISIVFLILSLISIFLGYGTMRESLMIAKGNKLSLDKGYAEADKVFEEAYLRYSSKTAQRNRGINLYNGEEYHKLTETGTGEAFLRGNAHAYLGEREKDPKKVMENYEGALEEYKDAMKVSGDINIKRNYEVISKRVEYMKNREQKQQEESKNNQNQKEQKKDKQGQDKKDNSQEQQQRDKQKDGSGNDQKDSKKDTSQKEQNTANQQMKDQEQRNSKKGNSENSLGEEDNKTNEQNKGQGREAEKDTPQRREALTILERLEGSEDQAFKNNERLESLGGEDSHEAW